MKWIGQHIWDFISRFRSDVYLEDLSDHGSDPDRFLTADSSTGKVTYRTGAEVLSDIGASSESTDLEFSGDTANGVLTYGGAAQIDVESTLTYVPDVSFLQSSAPAVTFSGFNQAIQPTTDWQTGSKAGSGFYTSFNMDRNTASGQTNLFTGVQVAIDDDGTHVGTIDYTGYNLYVDFANTSGTQKVKGINTLITDCDTADLYGIHQQIEDGGKDLYFLSSDTTTVDYFSIATGASGATTITTVDGDVAAANLDFTIDGEFTVDTGANEIDLTTTGTLDINANSLDMSLTDSSAILLTASEDAEDLQIGVGGVGHDSSLHLFSTGTGVDSIYIQAAPGGIDIDATTNITIDAANDISISAYDNATFGSSTADGLVTITSAFTGGTALHVDANAAADSVVDIDAGILDIDSSGATTITAVGTAELAGSTVTLDSAGDIELEVGAVSNYINTSGIYRGGNIGPISDTFIPLMPVDFATADGYRNYGSIAADGKSMIPSSASRLYIAQKTIPKGYTASTFRVNGVEGGGTTTGFIAYECDIDGTTPNAVTLVFGFNTNQTVITGRDIVGDGEKFVTIVMDPGDTSDLLYGGKISIAKTV